MQSSIGIAQALLQLTHPPLRMIRRRLVRVTVALGLLEGESERVAAAGSVGCERSVLSSQRVELRLQTGSVQAGMLELRGEGRALGGDAGLARRGGSVRLSCGETRDDGDDGTGERQRRKQAGRKASMKESKQEGCASGGMER